VGRSTGEIGLGGSGADKLSRIGTRPSGGIGYHQPIIPAEIDEIRMVAVG
jgi:chromosome segregation and condensation protein ScpB